VAQGPRKRQTPLAVALILLMCTVTGLVTGAGTRQLVTGLASSGTGTPPGINAEGTGTTASRNPATATSMPDPSPGAAGTATPVLPGDLTGFKLQVQVSPISVAVGQQFTIAVTVIARDRITPLEGVPCSIGAPAVQGVQLFTDWPPAVISNARGIAIWTLQAPNVPQGTYAMKISATGAGGYYYYTVASIVISGA
jgi:hypothetical protein